LKNEQLIQKQNLLVETAHNNVELICKVAAMIVESLNMQLEAEVADLLDRSSVSLYGASISP